MIHYDDLMDLPKLKTAYLTIGNFDGIHLGHKKIIDTLIQNAGEKEKVAITFKKAPFHILYPDKFKGYLFPQGHKRKWLEYFGFDRIFEVNFREVMPITAFDFIKFLKSRINNLFLFTGHNFRFGKGNEGDTDFLKNESNKMGFKLFVIDKLTKDRQEVSSTNIRGLLLNGNVETAGILLGRPFYYQSIREKGDGIGKTIGFPTLNMKIGRQVLPKAGVYFTYIYIRHSDKFYPSMTYIGNRPTVGKLELRLETHIIGFEKRLTDDNYTIIFIKKIRNEKKMNNLEELQKILYNDKTLILALDKGYKLSDDIKRIISGGI